jgi:DUF1365 family protein
LIAGSNLYTGAVIHRRLRPRTHELRFRAFWLLLDLDEIDALARKLGLFSRNRWNAVSFHDSDHGDGSTTPLRAQIEDRLRLAGIKPEGGAISLFCMPRIFGYGFNPLSVYFCRDCGGVLTAIVYQVHNTFGQRHSYVIPVTQPGDAVIDQSCDKDFFVSPFLSMAMHYVFRVQLPGERVSIRIEGGDADGPMIVAALAGVRRPLTTGALARMLAAYPFLTLKVIAGIHWHGLKMVLKGFKIYSHQ